MIKHEYRILIDRVLGATKTQLASPDKGFFFGKLAFVIIIYIFLIYNSLYDVMSPSHVPECVRDEMHELTLPINKHLAANPIMRSALIITASAMIDICVFAMALRWIIFGRTIKPLLAFMAFYAVRAFLQGVFFIKFPEEYIWGHPGLFSIAVPYFPANDFFYSGHVGMCVLTFLYFKREGLSFMTKFAFVAIIVEFFTLLVTRAHYFIDLITGLVFAHYIFLCVEWGYDYFEKRKEKKSPESSILEDDTSCESESVKSKENVKEVKKSVDGRHK